MWYPKLWLVVKPSVGLPLFFAGVAITSLIVHAAVLTHTTWFPAFFEGHSKAVLASSTAIRPAMADGSIYTPSVVINVTK